MSDWLSVLLCTGSRESVVMSDDEIASQFSQFGEVELSRVDRHSQCGVYIQVFQVADIIECCDAASSRDFV